MQVEIWSDFMCPFCYIGKRRFEEALQRFAHKEEVRLVFRSFELDPGAERDVNYDVHQMLADKYEISREQAVSMNRNVADQAQTVGLTFNFDRAIPTNTFDAHRLTQYAATQGKMPEMAERLFNAYFTDSKHIGDHETLASLAAEVGLDSAEAARMLAGTGFTEAVRSDEREAASLGIRGVPFFVINRKYAVSGAQDSDTFLSALHKAWDERPSFASPSPDANQAACTGDACSPMADEPYKG